MYRNTCVSYLSGVPTYIFNPMYCIVLHEHGFQDVKAFCLMIIAFFHAAWGLIFAQ